MRRDERAALARERAALLEEVAGRLVGQEHRVEGRARLRGGAHGVDDLLDETLRAREEHLPLVREVVEERALREARARSDVLDGGLAVTALGEELHRRFGEPAARVRFPARHRISS